jgi:hypothetical protein
MSKSKNLSRSRIKRMFAARDESSFGMWEGDGRRGGG